MNAITFKKIKEELPMSIQNKFIFQGEKDISTIIIRGLGVTDIQNQIENLTKWFEIMSNSVNKILFNKNNKN